jgi:hypothetical protein
MHTKLYQYFYVVTVHSIQIISIYCVTVVYGNGLVLAQRSTVIRDEEFNSVPVQEQQLRRSTTDLLTTSPVEDK